MFLSARTHSSIERFRHDLRILFYAAYCTSRQFDSNVKEDSREEFADLPLEQVTETNQYELLSETVTPLYKLPYEEQLKKKFLWTKEVVKEMSTKLKLFSKGKYIKPVYPRIERVRPSPVLEGYRNKDELNINVGADGNPKTLGYYIGRPGKGNVVCVPGTELLNMRSSHKAIAEDLPEERLMEEQDRLVDFFTNGPGATHCPHSLYFQACPHTRCSNQQAPFELLLGEPYLMEKMHGFSFRVSPDSFFQVNTRAAAVLYETVLSLAEIKSLTTVLDICCGTGTISILAAEQARGCVGIDYVHDSISDARHNAKLNNVFNAEFIAGLVEKKLLRVLRELEMAPDIVAVVNPGRTGLAPKAVRLLDECPQIRRVVYVSCKANHPCTRNNFIQLISEGKFTLRRVVPVDMFPHTMHTELVLLFER